MHQIFNILAYHVLFIVNKESLICFDCTGKVFETGFFLFIPDHKYSGLRHNCK
jgi:hypothetical protein